jgi:hypothetical protein
MMNARIVKMAMVASVTALYGFSFAGGDWNPTGTSNTTQAIYRSGNTSTTGSVGVGMTSPGSKLQVNGNGAIGYSSSTAAPTNGLLINGNTGIGTATVGSKLQVNGNGAIGYSSSTAAPTNGLLINGNTGIGTATVGSKLQVNGGAAIGYSSSTAAPTNGLAVKGAVGIGMTSPNSTLDVNGTIHTNGTLSVDGQISTSTGFFSMAMNGGNAATFMGPVNLGSSVGIGQDPGTEALEVSGNIKCNSVKINNWSIEAPDYVFEKDYKLPSLKTVEKHIVAEKHLPGVPSASDMKKNGVDLSQMNMTLLQKVEELTLYVIEQNKKIEALEKKIATK